MSFLCLVCLSDLLEYLVNLQVCTCTWPKSKPHRGKLQPPSWGFFNSRHAETRLLIDGSTEGCWGLGFIQSNATPYRRRQYKMSKCRGPGIRLFFGHAELGKTKRGGSVPQLTCGSRTRSAPKSVCSCWLPSLGGLLKAEEYTKSLNAASQAYANVLHPWPLNVVFLDEQASGSLSGKVSDALRLQQKLPATAPWPVRCGILTAPRQAKCDNRPL